MHGNDINDFSQLLTENFFDTILGIFRVNNLTVLVESPLRRSDIDDHTRERLQSVLESRSEDWSIDLKGTGLYALYSKMNHSCSGWNTRNSIPGTTHGVGIEVYASRDIQEGEEILTSYLHPQQLVLDPTATAAVNMNNPVMLPSFRRRQKCLLQYLFRCSCSLCKDQGLNYNSSDEDSDEEAEEIWS